MMRRALRAIAYAILGSFAVGFLGGSTCVVSSHHCHDADGDGSCDDHHQSTSTSPADEPWRSPERFRIERYTLIIGVEQRDRQARGIEDIRSVSMFRIVPRPASAQHGVAPRGR